MGVKCIEIIVHTESRAGVYYDEMSDGELLQEYVRPGPESETAFRGLVDRYAGLVFSIALRRVGNRQTAEEIAQNVFAALARKAGKIEVQTSLAGWLHQATMLESSKALRGEQRRKRKMDEYREIENSKQDETPDWIHVLPLLDEALHRLPSKERDLIFQHYFEGRTYKEISTRTGRTRAACAKQGARVLAKLCGMLKRQGVTISAIALGAGISSHLAKGVPPGLTQTLSQSALATVASTSANVSLFTMMTATKFTTAALLVATGAALPLSLQWANVAETFEKHPETTGSETVPDRVSSGPVSDGQQAEVAARLPEAGVDLQLLERELRKLPFPHGDIQRELDLERLMFQLREDEVPAVVALLQRLDPEHIGKITSALFARWGEFAPKTAALAAEDMGHKSLVYHAREGVMGAWAASDSASALRYLEKHPSGLKSSSMIWATIGDMVDRDPNQALSFVNEVITDEAVSDNVRKILLEAWGETDPDAALAWAETHDEKQSRSYSKTIIRRLANADPAKAFRLAMKTDHASIRAGSARWVLMQWIWQDPLAAADAYVNMPPGLYEDEQMMRTSVMLSGEAAKRDSNRAIQAANQLPEGPARENWIYGVAWEIASKAPEQAAALAESLPPSGSRNRALRHIGKQWLSKDAETASRWIEQSGHFDQKAIAKLLNH